MEKDIGDKSDRYDKIPIISTRGKSIYINGMSRISVIFITYVTVWVR